MRIVLSHVSSWPEVRRGGERYLHELAAALVAAGHDVQVLSTSPQPGTSRLLDVPVRYLRRRSFAGRHFRECADEVAFGLEAGARLACKRVDVWHALGTADAAAAAGLARVGRLRSVHTSLGIPERWYRDMRPDRHLHDYVVRHVDSYVCLSAAAGDALQQGWGRPPIVVGGGVDLRRFGPSATRHDRPTLLYSGTFGDPRKNVDLLLEAAAILRGRHPDLEVWLSGSGPVREVVERAPRAAQDAAVDLGVGAEEQQAERYGRAWVTVLPSEHEAFGLALIESLACGTPIVALADSGGPAEIVKAGVGFVATKSPEALADACDQALQLATDRGTAHACRTEAEHYDWRSAIVPRFEAIYRGEALESRRSR